MDQPSGIEITPSIILPESELGFTFIRSSGPGGQNVNKVATATQLRFDVLHSPSLPEEVRLRLLKLAKNRISEDGILIIEAKTYRTQEQNRQDAIDRLVNLIRRATEKPKIRKQTRPTLASKQRRLEQKRRRGEIKRLRRSPPGSAE
jgi:ribosome-associated protein